MRKICALAYIFSVTCFGEATENKLTIASKGDNLSNIIYDLFNKGNKNFVIDKEIIKKGSELKLYFNFSDVDFDSALKAICKNYGLKVDLKENIYYLSFGAYSENYFLSEDQKVKRPVFLPEPKMLSDKKPTLFSELSPKKSVPNYILKKIVTVRYKSIELKRLFQLLEKQVGVHIELSKDVPLYRLRTFLVRTSFEYALNEIVRQAKLTYEFTDRGTIHVSQNKNLKK